MKGQNLLDRGTDPVVQPEGNTGLSFLLAALEFEAKLNKEKLLEDEPDVGRRTRGLEVFKACACLGPMYFPQGLPRRHQCDVRSHHGGDGIRYFGRQMVE